VISLLLGLNLILNGVVVWLTTVHYQTAIALLLIGVILLAAGGSVYTTSRKTAPAR
jgi:hypothetical protein